MNPKILWITRMKSFPSLAQTQSPFIDIIPFASPDASRKEIRPEINWKNPHLLAGCMDGGKRLILCLAIRGLRGEARECCLFGCLYRGAKLGKKTVKIRSTLFWADDSTFAFAAVVSQLRKKHVCGQIRVNLECFLRFVQWPKMIFFLSCCKTAV